MEPNKFEKILKEQLQEREIRPAAEAWQKVAEQLEVDEPSNPKGRFWWGIAASVIGLLLVAVWFLNQGNAESNPEIQVVESPEEKTVSPQQVLEKDLKSVDLEKEQQVNGAVAASQATELDKARKKNTKETIVKENVAIEIQEDTGIETDIAATKVAPLNDGAETAIDLKIAELLAKVDDLEQDNIVLTDAEVDSLLLQAQKELVNDKLFRDDQSVDAMALLADVEEEIDESFRDQIFDKLKTGFLKVRTAVAQRNN